MPLKSCAMGASSSSNGFTVRPVSDPDYVAWSALWSDYVALSRRKDQTASPAGISTITWRRFIDPEQPVFAIVAEAEGQLVGLAHFVFHHSTARVGPACYLQDLFTRPDLRRRGVGAALINAVYAHAAEAGASRVYWHTEDVNSGGRSLFDGLATSTSFIVYTHNLVG